MNGGDDPRVLRLGNIRNGLAYPHDDVCAFQSQHAHHMSLGYFRIDAMPYRAVIHLLRGGTVEIIDATAHDKPLSDALRYGVPTWCLVFNRALRLYTPVCPWQTPQMVRAAWNARHRPLVRMIRKLAEIYGAAGPAVIGRNVRLKCYRSVTFDDKPSLLRTLVSRGELVA
jgi:hypothetical protein